MRFVIFLAAAISAATAAGAADVALVIGNADYENLRDVRRAGTVVPVARSLKDEGVLVLSERRATHEATQDLLQQFAQVAGNAEGVIVVLSGRFLTTGAETYFLPADSDGPSLADLSAKSLPLSVVEAMLARVPGRAVLVLATDESEARLGRYLTEGIGEIEPPQGVTVIEGDPLAVAEYIGSVLAVPESDLVGEAERIRGLSISGYMPSGLSFLLPPAGPVLPGSASDETEEAGYWNAARDLDTLEAYESYLRRYPDGPHASEARQAAAEIRSEPSRAARLAEEALALTREQRRQIQRGLSILDYNTRGIDGIFGPGTRAAITQWQEANGLDGTSYLTRVQVGRIASQAEARAAELEAEAERRRAEQERDDRAYWRATGAEGDEAGFRAYLKRYPDGRYAEIANARLEAIEAEKRRNSSSRERQFWEDVTQADTPGAYQSYLRQLPNGLFADEARARLAELNEEAQNAEARRRARAAEERLRLNDGTKRVIEQRLNALGLKPGPVDGTFDQKTRRAIRRFQRERGLEVTGFVNEPLIVRILAESVLR